MNNSNSTTIKTGKVRFSYAHVFEPVAITDGAEPQYSVSLLIPKTDTITINRINKAVELAVANGISSKWGGKKPAKLKLPLRDGDAERPDDENYAGMYFVNASSKKYKPGIIYKNGQEILDETDFYSGCYGLAQISFYPYKASGNMGVSCGLNNLMKTEDGEPLGGRVSASNAFAEDIENDEDFL